MKNITVTRGGWLDAQPPHVHSQLMRNIFDRKAKTGWSIRMQGQHWDA